MRFFNTIKSIKLAVLFAALATCFAAGAENRIFIEPFTISGYEPVEVPVMMDNDFDVYGVQVAFQLPDELEIVGQPTMDPVRLSNGQELAFQGIGVIITSWENKPISGNSGAIMTVKFRVKPGMLAANKNVDLNLTKMELAGKTSSEKVKLADSRTVVTLAGDRYSFSTPSAEAVVKPGTTFPIEVSMTNNTPMGGLQFLMNLPEGFDVQASAIKLSDRLTTGSRMRKTVRPDGTIAFVLVDMSNTQIAEAGEGLLFTLHVSVPASFEAAEATVKLYDIQVSTVPDAAGMTFTVKDPGFDVKVINCGKYVNDANEVIAGLRTALAEAVATIAENCPDVKDSYTGADITASIDAIAAAVAAATADNTLPSVYADVVTGPAAAVTAAIAKLKADATAAQAAFKAEAERVAANEAAYKTVSDEIAALQAKLDAMNKTVAETYPGIDVAAESAAAQEAINNVKTAAEAAYKAVETEGTFAYTFDAAPIDAAIAAIETAAKAAKAETERVAANEAAYKTVADEIAALQAKLDAMNKTVAETYPGINVNNQKNAAQAAIDKAKAEADAAFEAVATEGTFSYTVDGEAIEALIAAVETAAKLGAEEAARVAANEKAYNASLDEIKRLNDKLESMKMLVAVTYPKVDVDSYIAAAKEAIDNAKAGADAAYEAVAAEGVYNYTIDSAAIEALIDAIRKAAVEAQAALDAEAARVAANEAAYQTVLNEIAALQNKLNNMELLVNVSYPEADVTAEIAAAQQAVDNAGTEAAAALEAVAEEGKFDYTVNAKAIEALIAEILVAAKNSGIIDITVENDTDAVYYNLQGVRVAHPQSGQMLIRVGRDGKSEKVIIK